MTVYAKILASLIVLVAAILPSNSFSLADDNVPPKPLEPVVAEASREAQDAMAGVQLPEGWSIRLFAAEPNVANIVAFSLDNQGRAYVCESFRQNKGVTDNRGHDQEWLRADLSANKVSDRIAYHQRLLGPEGVKEYQSQDDRIRLLTDTDGDGLVDRSTVLAAGFNRLEDGTGAGVLEYRGSVYYTCIPKLWKFLDKDGDGQADERIVMHDGFGVRVAFRGHDMHGLIIGPDGRLYFSIGDRGYDVTTPEGKTLSDPSSGAVFRCELDGTNLEVFASGLRNPQELAFDQWGNLFTGDNNSDGGDRARWVYVVEGGITGWRMEYQYIPDRGPFNREKIWQPFHAEQPAYIVPPVENVGDGPSGLIYYPGTGLGNQLNDTFLLADFRGTPNQSGVRAIRVEPQGAHFKLASNEKLVWNILATDLAMGVDGGLYISDWVDGWEGTGKGRIFCLLNGQQQQTPISQTVTDLLRGDWSKQSNETLRELLGFQDQRVRQAAQFEIVDRQGLDLLRQVASDVNATDLARVHAIWGLGQLSRLKPAHRAAAMEFVLNFLNDPELQVRASASLVLGESRYAPASEKLIKLIDDPQPRVAHYAANAVYKLASPNAFDSAVQLLRRSNNEDPVLRHAAVLVLAATATNDCQLAALARDDNMAVRLGAVVALRRRSSSSIEAFLNDKSMQVTAEAVRAIHDLPIAPCLPAVAGLLSRQDLDAETAFRSLNANYRLGGTVCAERIAQYAARNTAPERMRVEALKMLTSWGTPDERDRYLNFWRPIEPRSAEPAKAALQKVMLELLESEPEVQHEAITAGVAYELTEVVEPLVGLLSSESSKTRSTAIRALAKLDQQRAKTLVEPMLSDPQWEISTVALEVLADLDPARAAKSLATAVVSPSAGQRQAAWKLAGKLREHSAAQSVLESGIDRYIAGELPSEDWLDLLQAATKGLSEAGKKKLAAQESKWVQSDPLNEWRWAMAGGNAERGRNLFLYKSEVSCLRCHKVGNKGGEVGPALTDLGSKKDAKYLLEAIVLPSNKIAEGFETVMIVDDIGTLHTGVLKQETEKFVEYVTAEGKLVRVDTEAIEERRKGNSAMPADIVKQLSREELRDLVAYLVSLKGQDQEEGH